MIGVLVAVVLLAVATVDVEIALLAAGPFAAVAPVVALWVVRGEASDVRRPWLELSAALLLGVITQVLYLVEDLGSSVAAGVATVTSVLSYVMVIKALTTIDRLRGANGLVAGVDAATVAFAAMLVAWHVGIDGGATAGVVAEAGLWIALALAASVVMVRLLLTGLWSVPAMRLLALALLSSVVAEATWFGITVGLVDVGFEGPAVLYLVGVFLALAGVAHPTRSLLVTSSTVARGTSSISVAGLGAGLVMVGVLGLGQRSGTLDTAVSVALATLVVAGVSVQVVVRDRALRRANAQLALRAEYDDLTGLLNRNGIRRRLDLVLSSVRRDERSAAVVFVDLDRFSVVNDGLGHDVGDEVLVAVASRLARVAGADHLVGRLGGDEFLVVLSGVDEREAMAVADRLLGACASPVASSAGPVQISASAGVLPVGTGEDVHLADAVRSADLAMYRAKRQGRGRVTLFDAELSSHIARRHGIEQALRSQADHGFRLELHHQPIVDPATGALRGFEALSRWDDPVLGRVAPDEFIAVAEDCGVIGALGRWALVEALSGLRSWRDASGRTDLWISVNVSGRQLTEPDLVDFVADALASAGLPAEALTLELTESSLIEHGTVDAATLDELRALGVGLAVDDFGTGYSSLAYLAKMPVTAVKIDRSFVDGLGASGSRGRPVVEAVVQLARSFGLKVVAEGVEETEQAIRLAEVGVDHAQGWLWWPAMPAGEALELVLSYPPTGDETTVSFPAASTHEAVSSNDGAHMKSVLPRTR